MKAKRIVSEDPRVQSAVAELQALIRHYYPGAAFEETHGEDPEGTYLMATVDVEDTDDVVDVYIERLLELQIDEGLSIYVVPIRPLEHISVP
ncbi:MAG: hypothetical protein ETSY2_46225 [Candidatus Entotheonella gemina]|uniref:Uncharacterized protein n=1 Tax=Candidatus Entotheonella gemina TaxID=1429439 RepID=W4LF25_9BACT|nr:MAG: hypothetical protein ETSY2_46225 [Candidatus Entotheonella gemina]